jgi:predicted DNA-binding protein YlxM (UPF0122 family)
MNKLAILKKSLESMSDTERLAKLREIREDRKISKHAVTVTKKREQDKHSKFARQFENLTAEERSKLLSSLKEKLNEGEAT